MKIHVESEATPAGPEMPQRFRLEGRTIEIVENIDQWHGPDCCYFSDKGEDGNLYILRMDMGRAAWELTMFQSAQAESFATQVYPGKRQLADR